MTVVRARERLSKGSGRIFSASLSISIASGALMVQACRLDHLSVGWEVYCGITASWIRMPFGVVRGRSRDGCIRWGWWSSNGKGQFWEWIWDVPL